MFREIWRAQRLKWRARRQPQSNEAVDIRLSSIFEGHLKVTYRGVQAWRSPFDYVLYQMILSEVRPDLVIEIGSHRGGGALYIADLMNALGHGKVHTIDIKNEFDPLVHSHPRIRTFSKGWQAYPLELAADYSTVLVIEDGAHTYEQTAGALEKFAPLVTPGSYFIVEDGVVSALGLADEFGGGPLRAIQEFLPRHPEFFVDRRWCDLFGHNATFNVDGYLRRRS